MRALVCGSREWSDQKIVDILLLGLQQTYNRLEIIEGEAPGADTCARLWAEQYGVEVRKFPADWGKNGKAAGFIRNQLMLDEAHPQVTFAFKDGFNAKPGRGGTEDMVRRSRGAGLPTFVISHGDGA